MLIKRDKTHDYDFEIVFKACFSERCKDIDDYEVAESYVGAEFNLNGKKLFVIQNENGIPLALTDNIDEFIEDVLPKVVEWVKEKYENVVKLEVEANGKVVKEVKL